MDKDERQNSSQADKGPWLRGPNLIIAALAAAAVLYFVFSLAGPTRSTISREFFETQVRRRVPVEETQTEQSNVTNVKIGQKELQGEFRDRPPTPEELSIQGKKISKYFRMDMPKSDEEQDKLWAFLEQNGIVPERAAEDNTYTVFLTILLLLPLVVVVFMWISYRRAQNQILGGGGFLSGFSKSPAKRYEQTSHPVKFKDVAGLDNVKADLNEIVDYLKDPQKFQRLGGRVPKGVLLNGPPGTGKTLLARAVAGEADVPFFSVNGSEFIQMFVGVGASRVRDLFKTAKDAAPSIIFIDEIDAVGRQRGAGLGGGHDEREQTLNQILGEMDGFQPSEATIVVAATNRPDILDPALLRPGRFDRHITVNRPTLKGRQEIFKVHVREVPLAEDVDLDVMAAGTVGLTGADIRNIVNEAALWAARNDKAIVEMEDFEYARDKVLMGAKREEVLSEAEKEKTAYHEAGHTLTAWNLQGAHRVHKVTIIPRGRALGATHMMPGEDRMNMSETELRDNLIVLLGGRAAEKLQYEETTVGAENDLERATGMARRMVTHWGMSDRLGPVSYKMSDDDPFLGRELHQQRQFSEHTMELIDQEVAQLLHESADRALEMLTKDRDKLEKLSEALVQEEELDERRIAELIGPSVHSASERNGKPMVVAPDEHTEGADAPTE